MQDYQYCLLALGILTIIFILFYIMGSSIEDIIINWREMHE
jgi:hypothetical protein